MESMSYILHLIATFIIAIVIPYTILVIVFILIENFYKDGEDK